MAEPDHIFVNPLPNLARGGYPAAFPFFYIKPSDNEKIIRKFYSEERGPVTDVDPIGNSPVIIQKVDDSAYSTPVQLVEIGDNLQHFVTDPVKMKLFIVYDICCFHFAHKSNSCSLLFIVHMYVTLFTFMHNLSSQSLT